MPDSTVAAQFVCDSLTPMPDHVTARPASSALMNRANVLSQVEADIYLWQDRLRPLLYGTWDEEAFKEQHLPSYVKMCGRFAEHLRR